ncbi:hypothetical protein PHYBOEH_010760 [Phytophthora boehmeriae]|uniref:Adenylate kinase n=1 Tax=Phytophthora boehmeriae TaxID=109152 RepID=A0A8T1WYE0_9STRA|nr:hypothetical protein PHYBOEH_010760 [Phytophthora boehmeriae]
MVLQLFVNGPPGSGKTTLAKLLSEEFNLEVIATGDLLRENMKAQTPSGRKAQRCIAAKTLVPDRVVVDMVEAKIISCTKRGREGWVLDSFPRTTDQAKLLIAKQDLFPTVVIVLELPKAECISRICGRRFDPVTGAIFHSPINVPSDAVVRARLTRRRDDSEERLSPRLEAYQAFGEATNELFKSSKGVVHRVDASMSAAKILDDVSSFLHSLVAQPQHDNSHISSSNQKQIDTSSVEPCLDKLSDSIVDMEKEEDDDNMHQQYQYSWEDNDTSVKSIQHESRQTKHEPEQVPPKEKSSPETKVDVGNQQDENKILSSTRMVALPIPTWPASPNNTEVVPPPPAPTLRPLPAPSGRFKGFSKPSEVKGPVAAAVDASATDIRSSSNSSIRSSCSTTNLEAAAASVDLEKFKKLLVEGFDAVKHGRRGRPHPRLIFTDLEFKRVFWQKAMAPADRVGKGKYARLDQSIALVDVIQVTRGMKTAVLKRSGNVARYENYVSLVTPKRTLDLEMPGAQLADFMQRGFDQLLHG